jgi:transcriptional regulator with XRE-family HTH domain
MTKAKVNGYKSYPIKDKDPVIGRLRKMLENEGLTYKEVSDLSGVSLQTFYNWFDGPTRRPQYATVMAIAGALGYKQVFRKGVNWL